MSLYAWDVGISRGGEKANPRGAEHGGVSNGYLVELMGIEPTTS